MRHSGTMPVAAITLAVMLGVMTACSSDSESESRAVPTTSTIASPTSTVPATTSTSSTTTTSMPPTLEQRIVADMQGAQTEYQNAFGENEFGIVFFHLGDWAAEAVEWPFGSGDHCLRATYTWSVVDATSESDFTIHYDELTEDPDCIALPATRFTLVFTGSQEVEGRTVYDVAYTAGLSDHEAVPGTRTVCSAEWNDSEPCGLTLAGFEMPMPPPE